MSDEPILRVAAKAAIVDASGKVLIIREAASGQDNTHVGEWGLVGGRLEAGEAFIDGLQREVMEETGLTIEPVKPLYVGEWRPVIRGTEHQIIAIFMLCRAKASKVATSNEHDSFLWIDPKKRQNYPMVEPDCYVVDLLAKEDLSFTSV